MWNRVVLLTCGMAFGWGLANYWAAPWSEIGKHRYRLAASSAVGMLLAAFLGWEDVGSGLIALAILAGSAAISYAANAKQMGKPVERAFARPDAAVRQDATPGVVLVADAEPERYAGPYPWAERLRQPGPGGRPAPHWLLRPYLCHRIRCAYARMPAGPPSWRALEALREQVQARLSTRAVLREAVLWGTPSLPETLQRLAQEGSGRLLVLPIDLEPDRIVDLRQAVVEARVREAGVVVEVLPGYAAGIWQAARSQENLARLLRGELPAELVEPGPAIADQIGALLGERL